MIGKLTMSAENSYLMNDVELRGSQNKWVCPSDRHLQLRAKLNSGWSVRTATGNRSPSSSSPSQKEINDLEYAQIQEVLERADASRKLEQQRVGKLVERLDNMRRRATGNGVTQCVLCSAEFGLLASRSYGAMCTDCRKYVCQRNCGLETYDQKRGELVFLCKICSEQREVMWKKSGAWFYREMPEYVRPTDAAGGSEQRSPSHQPRTSSTWTRHKGHDNKHRGGEDEQESSDDENVPDNQAVGARHNKRGPSHSTSSASRKLAAPAPPTDQHQRTRSPLILPRWLRDKIESSMSMEEEDENAASSSSEDGYKESGVVQQQQQGGRRQTRKVTESVKNPSVQRIAVSSSSRRMTDTESEGGPESNSPSPSSSPRPSIATPSSHGEDAVSQHQSSAMAGDVSDTKSIDSGVVHSDHSQSTLRRASASCASQQQNSSRLGGYSRPGVEHILEETTTTTVQHQHQHQQQLPIKSLSKPEQLHQDHPADSTDTAGSRAKLMQSRSSESGYRSASKQPLPSNSQVCLEEEPKIASLLSGPIFRSSSTRHPTFTTQLRIGQKNLDDAQYMNTSGLSADEKTANFASTSSQVEQNLERSKGRQLLDRVKSCRSSSRKRQITTISSRGSAIPLLSSIRRTYSQPWRPLPPSSTSSPSSAHSHFGSLGNIEFSLLYQTDEKQLIVNLIRARNLKAMDKNGFSDPYVKLHLIPGNAKATKLTSRTIEKSLNPEWQQQLIYYGLSEEDRQAKVLRLTVLDRDRIGADFLGETRVALKKLLPGHARHFDVCLEPPMPVDKSEETGDAGERGKILVSLSYNVQQGSLLVGIKRCAELIGLDASGYSDPYVKLALTPVTSKSHRQKTSIKKKTLNPEFKEMFALPVPLRDLPKKALAIGAYDHDVAKQDDYIGGLVFSMTAKGDRLRQWVQCIQNPGQTFEMWHRLAIDTSSK